MLPFFSAVIWHSVVMVVCSDGGGLVLPGSQRAFPVVLYRPGERRSLLHASGKASSVAGEGYKKIFATHKPAHFKFTRLFSVLATP